MCRRVGGAGLDRENGGGDREVVLRDTGEVFFGIFFSIG